MPDRDRAHRSSDTRAPVEDRLGREISAYRARLTTHADRDETFVAAETLVEEQGKRRYFYRSIRSLYGGERDRGDPRGMGRGKGEIDDGLDASERARDSGRFRIASIGTS